MKILISLKQTFSNCYKHEDIDSMQKISKLLRITQWPEE
jgi:hypothetical protein